MASGDVKPDNLINSKIPVIIMELKWADEFRLVNEPCQSEVAEDSGCVPLSCQWHHTNKNYYNTSFPYYTTTGNSVAGVYISGTAVINPGCKALAQTLTDDYCKTMIIGKNIYGCYGFFQGNHLNDITKDFLVRMVKWICRSSLTQSV